MAVSIPSKEMVMQVLQVSVTTRLLHWSGALLAVFLVGNVLVLGPMNRQFERVKKETVTLDEKLTKIDLIGQGTPDMDLVLERLDDEYRLLKSKVLEPREQAKVITLLTQTTEDLNIEIINISPIHEKNSKAATEDAENEKKIIPALFQLEMVCRYKTLGIFFERLKHAPLLLTIESFTATLRENQAPFLHVVVVLAAYEEKGL